MIGAREEDAEERKAVDDPPERLVGLRGAKLDGAGRRTRDADLGQLPSVGLVRGMLGVVHDRSDDPLGRTPVPLRVGDKLCDLRLARTALGVEVRLHGARIERRAMVGEARRARDLD